MLVECKEFLEELESLKDDAIKCIDECRIQNSKLANKLEQELVKILDEYIAVLDGMEPGTIVEVI